MYKRNNDIIITENNNNLVRTMFSMKMQYCAGNNYHFPNEPDTHDA